MNDMISFVLESIERDRQNRRAIQYLNRRIGNLCGSVAVSTIVSSGLIYIVARQRDRIAKLEKQLNKEETAG